MWLMLVLLVVSPAFSQEAIGTKAVHETILVADKEFTLKRIQSLASQFLQSHRSARLAVLNVVTPSSLKALRRPPESASLQELVEHSKRAGRLPYNCARLLSLGDEKVLDVRYASGKLEHIPIGSGGDPRFFRTGELVLRVVEVTVSKLHLPMLQYSPSDGGRVDLWLTADRLPNPKEGLQIWEYWKNLTGVSNLNISVRTTPWWQMGGTLPYPPFEDPKDVLYKTMEEAPYLHIGSFSRGVEYLLRDGVTDQRVLLLPPLR